MKNPNHLPNAEIFKIALDTRNFEIKMFWQRCNYFLWLNTLVGVAFAGAIAGAGEDARSFYVVVIPIIGAFVCLAWIKVGLGAKYWQSYWEQVLIDFQRGVGFTSPKKPEDVTNNNIDKEKNFFSRPGYTEISTRVKRNLGRHRDLNFKDYCRKFPRYLKRFRYEFILFLGLFLPFQAKAYKNNVMRKPSVSGWMHMTACFFFWVWVVILFWQILSLCPQIIAIFFLLALPVYWYIVSNRK